jgi:GTP-binding protein
MTALSCLRASRQSLLLYKSNNRPSFGKYHPSPSTHVQHRQIVNSFSSLSVERSATLNRLPRALSSVAPSILSGEVYNANLRDSSSLYWSTNKQQTHRYGVPSTRTFSTSTISSQAQDSDDEDLTTGSTDKANKTLINGMYYTTTTPGIRNVAVVAHVDHGKTTLVDQLLKTTAMIDTNKAATAAGGDGETELVLDSGELEKERGITITSKVTRLLYQPINTDTSNAAAPSSDKIIINCVDTPGHADFAGEVDRILSMVDGIVLVVDAAEGPKPQTKYVLGRYLATRTSPDNPHSRVTPPIVVLNKCDRPDALDALDRGTTEEQVTNLWEHLWASRGLGESAPHCTFLYASAKQGWTTSDPCLALEWVTGGESDESRSMHPLLQHIVSDIDAPTVRVYSSATTESTNTDSSKDACRKFSLAAVTVGMDAYLGRICTGRISSGEVAVGDKVNVLRRRADISTENGASSTTGNSASSSFSGPNTTVSGIFVYHGAHRVPLESTRAVAGDIITLTGVPADVAVGDTVTSADTPIPEAIDTPPLPPPTLSMTLGANNGPLAGKYIMYYRVEDSTNCETTAG